VVTFLYIRKHIFGSKVEHLVLTMPRVLLRLDFKTNFSFVFYCIYGFINENIRNPRRCSGVAQVTLFPCFFICGTVDAKHVEVSFICVCVRAVSCFCCSLPVCVGVC